MRFPLTILALVAAMMISPTSAFNQDVVSQPKWQVGLSGGIAQYHGDISIKSWTSKFSGETKLAFGAFARHHFNGKAGLGIGFQRAGLFGAKPLKSDGVTAFDLQYKGNINQFYLHSYLNFSNFFFGEAERTVNFYGTLGIGFIQWQGDLTKISDGTLVTNNSNAAAQNLKTNGASFPVSIGVSFNIAPSLNLFVEASMMNALTDEVDFFRDGYQYDIITTAQVGLSYQFGCGGKKVQKIRNPEQITRWEPETPISVIEYEIYNDPPVKKVIRDTIPQLQLPAKEMQPAVQSFPPFEFRVQIYAKTTRAAIGDKIYRNVTFEYPIIENTYNGLYRYSTGSFKTYAEAESYARTMQSRGIYDAFVVAYSNNERISITSEMKNRK